MKTAHFPFILLWCVLVAFYAMNVSTSAAERPECIEIWPDSCGKATTKLSREGFTEELPRERLVPPSDAKPEIVCRSRQIPSDAEAQALVQQALASTHRFVRYNIAAARLPTSVIARFPSGELAVLGERRGYLCIVRPNEDPVFARD